METVGCTGFDAIVITHHHIDHIGGLKQLRELYGTIPTYKLMNGSATKTTPEDDYIALKDGDEIRTTGATLRCVATPGHTDDHASFLLVEVRALLSAAVATIG